MGSACSQNGRRQQYFQTLTDKPIVNRLLRRLRRRLEDNNINYVENCVKHKIGLIDGRTILECTLKK